MLAERAPFDFRHAASGLLRTCFSLLVCTLSLVPWSLRANSHSAPGEKVAVAEDCSQGTTAAQPCVVAPLAEMSELYPPTHFQLDTDNTRVLLWQSPLLTSSRIIPQGLVLSFLCDSARHQCSGVQLA